MSIDAEIRALIDQNGSITIAKMMQEALFAHSSSYYKNKFAIGANHDFITAPEISQMFGEVIGLWCLEYWSQSAKNQKIHLVELGGGTGKLMRDILSAAKVMPEFLNHVEVTILDINPHLMDLQSRHLSEFNVPIKWISNIYEIPSEKIFLVANEFFDAMPIKQYVKEKTFWKEMVVSIDPVSGQFIFDKRDIPDILHNQFLSDHPNAKDGAVLEESLESLEIVRYIARHLEKFGGVGIIIDYGYDLDSLQRKSNQYNSTLQAVKNHQYHPLFDCLGEADITAHVDFFALKKAMNEVGLSACICSQRDFLIKYGIEKRAEMLKHNLNPVEAKIIDRQLDRLISEKQMGNLFKVLSVVH